MAADCASIYALKTKYISHGHKKVCMRKSEIPLHTYRPQVGGDASQGTFFEVYGNFVIRYFLYYKKAQQLKTATLSSLSIIHTFSYSLEHFFQVLILAPDLWISPLRPPSVSFLQKISSSVYAVLWQTAFS